MARFTTAGGSGDGTPGAPGPAGSNGADAIWNYTGEYSGGAAYAVGDLATYDGQLWYRANANGGNVGDTPSQGFIWNLLAAKGTDGTNGSSGLVYLGNYISGNGYVTDLAVVRGSDNNLYIAKANGGLADPVGNTAEWDIFSTNTGGGTANIADFIFTNDGEGEQSIISLPGDKAMRIEAGSDSDLFLTAGDDLYIQTLGSGDDIHIQAADDIRFTTNNEDFEVAGTVPQWTMNSDGEFHLPGAGYISNPIDSSGDGYGNDTIKIVPDDDLVYNGGDQYLIIDPTAPNHIHVRAGGDQDDSNADLILGGELTNVRVSDGGRNVTISSKPIPQSMAHLNINLTQNDYLVTTDVVTATQGWTVDVNGTSYYITDVLSDNPTQGNTTIIAPGAPFIFEGVYNVFAPQSTYQWEFDYDGYIYGPAQGGLLVTGLNNNQGNLFIASEDNVVLNGSDGEYLNEVSPENQIATIGDVMSATSIEQSFTVNGGTLGTQPTFDGAPLFSGTYVINGPMVHFQIQVDMDNITNFGTGQYYVDLPFPAKYSYHFRDACLHDTSGTVRQYALSGHVYAGQSRVTLWFTSTSGQDELFDYNSPALLTVSDNFHISGTYISE